MNEKWPLYFDEPSFKKFLIETALKLAEDCREVFTHINPTPEELAELPKFIDHMKATGLLVSNNLRIDNLVTLDLAYNLHSKVIAEKDEVSLLELTTSLLAGQNLLSQVLGKCLGIEFRSHEQRRQDARKRAVDAGLASGKNRRKISRADPEKVHKAAHDLLSTGTPRHQIASKLGARFNVSADRIRQILREKTGSELR